MEVLKTSETLVLYKDFKSENYVKKEIKYSHFSRQELFYSERFFDDFIFPHFILIRLTNFLTFSSKHLRFALNPR